MPDAPLKACPRCGTLHRRSCPTCSKLYDANRGSSKHRGLSQSKWDRFRRRFIDELVSQGISPVCGAALPAGPATQDSRCKAQGLHRPARQVDHEPPLTERERQRAVEGDRTAVDDLSRVQLLCDGCHAAKTTRERLSLTGGMRNVS